MALAVDKCIVSQIWNLVERGTQAFQEKLTNCISANAWTSNFGKLYVFSHGNYVPLESLERLVLPFKGFITSTIRELKARKAPGPDKHSPDLLKLDLD